MESTTMIFVFIASLCFIQGAHLLWSLSMSVDAEYWKDYFHRQRERNDDKFNDVTDRIRTIESRFGPLKKD